METAIVTFDNGDIITSAINGTDEEILRYYRVGRIFNIGHNGEDFMAKVKSAHILDGDKQASVSRAIIHGNASRRTRGQ